jgi:hypothetical protein
VPPLITFLHDLTEKVASFSPICRAGLRRDGRHLTMPSKISKPNSQMPLLRDTDDSDRSSVFRDDDNYSAASYDAREDDKAKGWGLKHKDTLRYLSFVCAILSW